MIKMARMATVIWLEAIERDAAYGEHGFGATQGLLQQ